jgi:hypothetical protein
MTASLTTHFRLVEQKPLWNSKAKKRAARLLLAVQPQKRARVGQAFLPDQESQTARRQAVEAIQERDMARCLAAQACQERDDALALRDAAFSEAHELRKEQSLGQHFEFSFCVNATKKKWALFAFWNSKNEAVLLTPDQLALQGFKTVKLPVLGVVPAEARTPTVSVHALVMCFDVIKTAQENQVAIHGDKDVYHVAELVVKAAVDAAHPLILHGGPAHLSIHTGSKVHASMPMRADALAHSDSPPNRLSQRPALWSTIKAAALQQGRSWVQDPMLRTQSCLWLGCGNYAAPQFRVYSNKRSACAGMSQIAAFRVD